MTPYPTMDRVYKELVQLEAFKKSAPEVQPDAEV